MSSKFTRRNFLIKSTLAGTAISLAPLAKASDLPSPSSGSYMGNYAAPKLETIRAAFIGVGARGPEHVKSFAGLPGTEVAAICDLYPDLASRAADIAKAAAGSDQKKDIKIYSGAEESWKRMLEDVKPDVVFICTNWKNHASMAIEAMKSGAHAFVEVPIALSIGEMWDIVNTSEETRKHCMMMENVNYSRDELLFLNMIRKGVLGELLHGEASYIHELRFQMKEEERGTGSWRTHHYAKRNGNLYPTHGLGPVAQYMNIARSKDNFKHIVSYSTPARGRAAYARKTYPSEHKWNHLSYKGGDLNTSIIKTTLGRTIMVQWDETSPRPYTRLNLIQGTKGTLAGFPTRVALEGGVEGLNEDHHSWVQGDDLKVLYQKYDHPLYTRLNEKTKNTGHGGMDGIMMYRIVECLRQGLALDQNVYEGCLWSAVAPLSEASVKLDGAPQQFPDFTRGNWRTTDPLGIVT